MDVLASLFVFGNASARTEQDQDEGSPHLSKWFLEGDLDLRPPEIVMVGFVMFFLKRCLRLQTHPSTGLNQRHRGLLAGATAGWWAILQAWEGSWCCWTVERHAVLLPRLGRVILVRPCRVKGTALQRGHLSKYAHSCVAAIAGRYAMVETMNEKDFDLGKGIAVLL